MCAERTHWISHIVTYAQQPLRFACPRSFAVVTTGKSCFPLTADHCRKYVLCCRTFLRRRWCAPQVWFTRTVLSAVSDLFAVNERCGRYSDELDQLNVIFDVIGTPSSVDCGIFETVEEYLRKLKPKPPRKFESIWPVHGQAPSFVGRPRGRTTQVPLWTEFRDRATRTLESKNIGIRVRSLVPSFHHPPCSSCPSLLPSLPQAGHAPGVP